MEPELTADDLPSRIAGFDGLVVRSTKVKRAVFEAADRLTLVIRAGAGTNTIDTDAAAASGVFVSNVPGRNAAAVAELTMGLLLAIDRRIADNVADLRSGHWDKKRYSKAGGLLGSTMGIIGLGSIGLAVAERAAAFGIQVQSLAKPGRPSHVVTRAEELDITMCDSMRELVSSSDIVSLHVPSCEDTRHLVDDSFLALMRTRRDPPQHLEGRRGRRGRPAQGPGRRRGARRPGRVRGRTELRQGSLGLAPRPAPRSRRDPPHRRLDGAGATRHRRGRDGDRRRVHVRRATPLREPRTAVDSGRSP